MSKKRTARDEHVCSCTCRNSAAVGPILHFLRNLLRSIHARDAFVPLRVAISNAKRRGTEDGARVGHGVARPLQRC